MYLTNLTNIAKRLGIENPADPVVPSTGWEKHNSQTAAPGRIATLPRSPQLDAVLKTLSEAGESDFTKLAAIVRLSETANWKDMTLLPIERFAVELARLGNLSHPAFIKVLLAMLANQCDEQHGSDDLEYTEQAISFFEDKLIEWNELLQPESVS